MDNIAAVVSTIKKQMKITFARATFQFTVLLQPIIFVTIAYMMYKDSGRANFANYVILGSGLSSIWSSICFSSAGDIERERRMGTLEYISVAPVNFYAILWGQVIGNMILGLLGMTISYVFAVTVFKVEFIIMNPLWFIISSILTLLSFMGVALVIAGVFTLSRNARGLMNCLEMPVFLLCGMMFPLEVLPEWTRPISYVLSPTWAVKALNMSVSGTLDYSTFMPILGILALLAIVYIIGSYYLCLTIEKRTRVKASLGVY